MTRLEILNKFFLQFFFIRAFKTLDGSKFGILYFIFPLSGWKNDFKIIGKKIKTIYLKK